MIVLPIYFEYLGIILGIMALASTLINPQNRVKDLRLQCPSPDQQQLWCPHLLAGDQTACN